MRRSIVTVLRTIAATLVAGTASAAPAGEATIRDPHYGDALFHFYQEHYFTSLTGLMVSQHFDRVRQHADEAEILQAFGRKAAGEDSAEYTDARKRFLKAGIRWVGAPSAFWSVKILTPSLLVMLFLFLRLSVFKLFKGMITTAQEETDKDRFEHLQYLLQYLLIQLPK